MTLNPQHVHDLFDYFDGKLIWRHRPQFKFKNQQVYVAWNTRFAGKEAGRAGVDGYRRVGVTVGNKTRRYSTHRLVWAWHHGRWPTEQIDHIDHDRANNRIENLREVSRTENLQNQKLYSSNTSGVVGVYWSRDRQQWRASIRVDGERINLGTFDCKSEAIEARKSAEEKFGFHENHGAPA